MPPAARRRPTVKDVAALAGVAPMTVSYSFNQPARVAPETRARVLKAAAEVGYRPDRTARALRSGRTQQLGVVVGEHLSYVFEDPQAAQFVAGVADVCVDEDLGLMLIPTTGDAGDVERVLVAAVDGYVLWTTVADDPVLAAVAGSGRPAAIQGGPAHEGLACIGPDDREAAAAVAAATPLRGATPLVISFPFDRERRSGVLRGRDLPYDLLDPKQVPFPVTAARLAGYRDALAAAGHHWADVPIAVVERNERRLGEAGLTNLVAELVPGSPDADPLVVLAMSDELALGALRALASRSAPQGAAPGATVTGWDASREAAAAGIWSVSVSLRDQGRACARAALSGGTGVQRVPWTIVPPDPAARPGAPDA